jgi:hypothetical protein
MKLTISAKQLGRKNALISKKIIEVEDIGAEPTLEALIHAVVIQQVNEFNSKPLEKNILPFLDQETIDTSASSGKLGFGAIYKDRKADPDTAVKTAIQAFEDGLFAVFAGEEEWTGLDQKMAVTEETIISFVRLTFLAGSYW